MANWYTDQLDNRNFLSPIGFLFLIEKAKKVSFLCQKASIHTLSLGQVDIPTAGRVSIPIEGNVQYGNLDIDFIVDEDLRNYMEIHNWIRALGLPSDNDERAAWVDTWSRGDARRTAYDSAKYSDATLQVLNNNNLTNFEVIFENMFPTQLSTMDFDVTGSDNDFMIATATFSYTLFEVRNTNSSKRR